jgi:hypothetical protein
LGRGICAMVRCQGHPAQLRDAAQHRYRVIIQTGEQTSHVETKWTVVS